MGRFEGKRRELNPSLRKESTTQRGEDGLRSAHYQFGKFMNVAALSHLLLNETDVPGDLIWAMIGLEALYGRDQAPVGTQLMRKAELLLGARKTHKRVMKEAYRFRSKLVHGEIDIPFFQNDPNEPDFAQFVQNNSDATLLAQAVLVASIQELIRRSEHVLEFEYTIARDGSGL
jgi:hypothetical protein